MHQPADVVLIVADAELLLDGRWQAPGRPAIVRETVRRRAFEIHLADAIHLVGGETAGTPSGSPRRIPSKPLWTMDRCQRDAVVRLTPYLRATCD